MAWSPFSKSQPLADGDEFDSIQSPTFVVHEASDNQYSQKTKKTMGLGGMNCLQKLRPHCDTRPGHTRFMSNLALSHMYCATFGENSIFLGMCNGSIAEFPLSPLMIGQKLSPIWKMRAQSDIIRGLAVFEQDGDKFVYSGSGDGTLKCINTQTNESVTAVKYRAPIDCVAQWNGIVYAGTQDGVTICYDTWQSKIVNSFKLHTCAVKAMVATQNRLYSCSLDGLVKGVDTETKQLIAVYEGQGQPLRSIITIHEGVEDGEQLLVAGSSSGKIFLYDLRASRCIYSLDGHKDAVMSLHYPTGGSDSRDHHMIYSGGDDRIIVHHCLRTRTTIGEYRGHSDSVKAIKTSRDGIRLISVSADRTARAWNFWHHDPMEDPELVEHLAEGKVSSIQGAPDMAVDFLCRIKETFNKFAKVQTGAGFKALNKEYFTQCLKALGIDNMHTIKLLWESFETSGDGLVDGTEVMDLLEAFLLENLDETIQCAFQLFDEDKSGKVSLSDIKMMMARDERTLESSGLNMRMLQLIAKNLRTGQAVMDLNRFYEFVLTNPTLSRVMFPVFAMHYIDVHIGVSVPGKLRRKTSLNVVRGPSVMKQDAINHRLSTQQSFMGDAEWNGLSVGANGHARKASRASNARKSFAAQ